MSEHIIVDRNDAVLSLTMARPERRNAITVAMYAALADAIEGAARDREAAAQLLAEQQRQLDATRADAQKLLADARAAGEQVRNDMLEQARREQEELLARARREIESERLRAVADLRREAVDLAIAGAGRVIERNLDDQSNRQLVESFLSSVSVGDGRTPGR